MAVLLDGASYIEAIQNRNNICFGNYTFDKDRNGLPVRSAGQNGMIIRMRDANGAHAVKFFFKFEREQFERYNKFQTYLDQIGSESFLRFRFFKEGLRFRGRSYPVLTMPWINGVTMDRYLMLNRNDRKKIISFTEKFLGILAQMRAKGICHGDLQHGNILVTNDIPFLVDYDGVYVPDFQGQKRFERGHVDYTHPSASTSFNADIDNFPSWMILASLLGLIYQPSLYDDHCDANGIDSPDRLLFSSKDIEDPYRSRTIDAFESSRSPILKKIGSIIKTICLDPWMTPSPVDFRLPSFRQGDDWIAKYFDNVVTKGAICRERSNYELYIAFGNGALLKNVVTEAKGGKLTGDYIATDGSEVVSRKTVVGNWLRGHTGSPEITAHELFKEGLILKSHCKWMPAISKFEEAVRLCRDHSGALFELGYAHEMLGNVPLAIAYYERSVGLDGRDPEKFYQMGNALMTLDKMPQAKIYFEKVIALEAQHQGAHYALGCILKKEYRFALAKYHFQKVIKIHNSTYLAKEAIGRLQEIDGTLGGQGRSTS